MRRVFNPNFTVDDALYLVKNQKIAISADFDKYKEEIHEILSEALMKEGISSYNNLFTSMFGEQRRSFKMNAVIASFTIEATRYLENKGASLNYYLPTVELARAKEYPTNPLGFMSRYPNGAVLSFDNVKMDKEFLSVLTEHKYIYR